MLYGKNRDPKPLQRKLKDVSCPGSQSWYGLDYALQLLCIEAGMGLPGRIPLIQVAQFHPEHRCLNFIEGALTPENLMLIANERTVITQLTDKFCKFCVVCYARSCFPISS